MTNAELSRLIRADADAAVSGGVGARRPVHAMPANPTEDHRVAFALGDVRDAVCAAYDAGATESEIERACLIGRKL